MGAFQIAFILVNLAVPAWLWLRNSPEDPKVQENEIQWEVLGNNLERLIANGGGFLPCSDRGTMLFIKQACEASKAKWDRNDSSSLIARVGPDVTFGCEVNGKYIAVSFRAEKNEDDEIDCSNRNGQQLAHLAPLFEFNYKGQFRRIEFESSLGARQSVMATGCRRKLKIAKQTRVTSENELLERLGRDYKDPGDYMRASQLCLTYDIASAWEPIRKSIRQNRN